ncbi:MAG: diversity-generating retroelement protein Avd [Acidobacteria bacterium]|nr:diversity-generating retroelement protein Avd [Acidobacteriota bacterium]
MKKAPTELPIIQKTYDLIRWYVPHLNRLPRDHKFMLGNRLIEGLYELLDGLIVARYSTEKLARLESLNSLLDVIRYQTRLLKDFELLDLRRYEFVSRLIDDIGRSLGGWIGQQRSLQAQ